MLWSKRKLSMSTNCVCVLTNVHTRSLTKVNVSQERFKVSQRSKNSNKYCSQNVLSQTDHGFFSSLFEVSKVRSQMR